MTRARSLDQALRRGMWATVLWAVLTAGLGGGLTAYVAVHAQTARHVDLLARSIGYRVEAAVAFRDAEAAREIVREVLAREELVSVKLWLADGELFAEAHGAPQSAWAARMHALLARVLPLHMRAPLSASKPGLGEVEVEAQGSALGGLLLAYVAGIGTIMLTTGGVAALVSRRVSRQIGRPIETLRHLTRGIRNDRTFARRAPSAGIVEIDALSDDFNALLETVQAYETELLQRQNQLVHHNRALSHEAFHDQLTGLSNRAHFHLALADALARGADRELAVLFIDADGLKQVNDRHGHAAGDQLLRAVAERLRRALRESDIVARLGGDEFGVLLDPLTRREHVTALLRKIQEHVAAPLAIEEGIELLPSVSIGWAIYPLDAGDADGLLEHADQVMYEHKCAKRSRADARQPGESANWEPFDEFPTPQLARADGADATAGMHDATATATAAAGGSASPPRQGPGGPGISPG